MNNHDFDNLFKILFNCRVVKLFDCNCVIIFFFTASFNLVLCIEFIMRFISFLKGNDFDAGALEDELGTSDADALEAELGTSDADALEAELVPSGFEINDFPLFNKLPNHDDSVLY